MATSPRLFLMPLIYVLGAGNPHDLVCFECQQPGDLEPCETCRRSYHEACKPNNGSYSNRGGLRSWYCSVCVDRRWHIAPPPLSPPASPRTFPVEDVNPSLSRSDVHPARDTRTAHSGPLLEAQRHSSSRVLDASTISGSDAGYMRPSDSPATAPAQASATNDSPAQAMDLDVSNAQRLRSSKTSRESPGRSASRRSRFSTLSKDVDSALWVLYCELEQIPLLHQKISDLETEAAGLRQELRMRQNELALTKVMAEKARVAEVEISRLRTEIANNQTGTNEVEMLRARNQELESHLAASRREVENSMKTLGEWKQKLSSMLGD